MKLTKRTVDPQTKVVQKVFESIHVFGQWLVYALVLLHIAGTAWHLVIRRDGLLERMLPVQDARGSSR